MIGNKHKATYILGIVSCGFFLSYPFHHTFTGGLLSEGFGAAMIGGLADWFAVSALFRRPLGISFRTAIIPNNRKKIFEALAHMVENQLLMKEKIQERLKEYSIASALSQVMISHGGRNFMKRILYSLICEILEHLNAKELGMITDQIIKDTVRSITLAPYALQGGEWLIKKGYEKKLMTFLLKQLVLLVESEEAKRLLIECVCIVRQRYEHGMGRRKLFNQLLNLSSEQVAEMVQQGLKSYLLAVQDEKHVLRQRCKVWLEQWFIAKRTDEIFQKRMDSWIREIVMRTDFASYTAEVITGVCEEALTDQRQIIKIVELLICQTDRIIADFMKTKEDQAKLDLLLKGMLEDWLDRYHNEIGKMVMDSLHGFTDEMLVAFIESKVGNDLQMVRINGSVVGGLVGMGLYLVTFWL